MNDSKKYITSKVLMLIYYAMLYPYLSYGILLWGSSCKTYLHEIEVMLKTAIRAITNRAYSDFFKVFHILKLNDIYKLHLGKFMFSLIHSLSLTPE